MRVIDECRLLAWKLASLRSSNVELEQRNAFRRERIEALERRVRAMEHAREVAVLDAETEGDGR